MRMKGFILFGLGVALALGAGAARGKEITLVLVPREEGALRVGLDLARRYPTLLVSYQLQGGKAALLGWTGSKWGRVHLDTFQRGAFFSKAPDSALIIEREGEPLPAALIPAADWCPAVYKITTTRTRPLLHLTGQYYNFKYRDWAWFSERYTLSMEAINPEGLNVSWYHRSLGEQLKKRSAAGNDLIYWAAVRHPVPPVEEEPVEAPAVVETNGVEEAAAPEMELPEDPIFVNPLTNAAPIAVVIGPSAASDKE